jgi:hypothetical protein
VLLPLLERGEKIRVGSSGAESRPIDKPMAAAGTIQMETMHLLIKTQLLICRRYEQDMARLKYPAYSVLLACLKLSDFSQDGAAVSDSEFMKSERAAFVQITVELIYRTCLMSPRNSDELVSENGAQVLAEVLAFYVAAALNMEKSNIEPRKGTSRALASGGTIGGIICYSVRTLSGMAYFERGRDAIKKLPKLASFLVNWRQCLDGSLSRESQMMDSTRYAIEGVAHFAMDSTLQNDLVGSGVIWPLLKCALLFDSTLEKVSIDSSDQDDTGVSIASINVAARLSIRALGTLSGLFGSGPTNNALASALNRLLTAPVASMLRNKRTGVILQVLNSNVERSNIIWNLPMRQQLDAFLVKRMQELPTESCNSAQAELITVDDFEYEALKAEFRIGDVYLRCFNKDGQDGLSHVENPNNFLHAIVNFIAMSMDQADCSERAIAATSKGSPASGSATNEFLLAMIALRILCRVDGMLDDVLLTDPGIIPETLLRLLELPQELEVSVQF